MRRASGLTLVVLLACGGNVVFVEDGGSDDGGGGAGTGATGTGGRGGSPTGMGGAPTTNDTTITSAVGGSGGSGGSEVSCEATECEVGQVACTCRGECVTCSKFECFSFPAITECQWEEDGATCKCLLGEQDLGTCFQLDLDCDTGTGCCAELFAEALP